MNICNITYSITYNDYQIGGISIPPSFCNSPQDQYIPSYNVHSYTYTNVSAPIMTPESWAVFKQWMNDVKMEDCLSRDEIIRRFEEDTKHLIQWVEKP